MGRLTETSCTIIDLKGVGVSKAKSAYGYIQKTSVISQNYYPERMGKLYLINAPFGFATVWHFIKGWLDPVTQKKIEVLGSGYKDHLLRQVPPQNLPKHLGGTCVCKGGCELSDAGPWQEPEWTNDTWTRKANEQPQEELEAEWKQIRSSRR